jgi:DNA repair protein RecN (Recombination protein N)
VGQLRELGALLIDVHGQNDGRKLMDESSHLKYLDAFARDEEALSAYRGVYDLLRQTEKEIGELTMDESEKERRMDMLRYQIADWSGQSWTRGIGQAHGARELLKNASRLTDALEGAFAALYGGEDGGGAAALLSSAEGSCLAPHGMRSSLSHLPRGSVICATACRMQRRSCATSGRSWTFPRRSWTASNRGLTA